MRHAAGNDVTSVREPQDVDPERPALLGETDEPAVLDRRIALDQHEDGWTGRFVLRRPPVDELLEIRDQFRGCRRGGRKVPRHDRTVRRCRVREPLQPVPVLSRLSGRESRNDELGRGMENRYLRDECPRDAEHDWPRAGNAQCAVLPRNPDDRNTVNAQENPRRGFQFGEQIAWRAFAVRELNRVP